VRQDSVWGSYPGGGARFSGEQVSLKKADLFFMFAVILFAAELFAVSESAFR